MTATYQEAHWFTHKVKTRCTADGKVVFLSREQATQAAEAISERTPMKAYCGDCGHWHVSRRKGTS